MRFLRIDRAELPRWHRELEALEADARYPLGDDAFRLSHGPDYFAFFERLGALRYYALEDRGRLVAVGCGMLRTPEVGPRHWYLADLKVHPAYRGRHLPIALFRRAFVQNYVRAPRGYGIAMDPPDGRVPPAVRLLAHFRFLPPSLLDTTRLDLWSSDEAGMRRALPLLAPGRGTPRFVSLLGVKDLVLESTGAPLPLLHLSFASRPERRTFAEPQPGHTHMWCLPRGAPLAAALAAAGFRPSASATIVHHRMRGYDWARIDTSEI